MAQKFLNDNNIKLNEKSLMPFYDLFLDLSSDACEKKDNAIHTLTRFFTLILPVIISYLIWLEKKLLCIIKRLVNFLSNRLIERATIAQSLAHCITETSPMCASLPEGKTELSLMVNKKHCCSNLNLNMQ